MSLSMQSLSGSYSSEVATGAVKTSLVKSLCLKQIKVYGKIKCLVNLLTAYKRSFVASFSLWSMCKRHHSDGRDIVRHKSQFT